MSSGKYNFFNHENRSLLNRGRCLRDKRSDETFLLLTDRCNTSNGAGSAKIFSATLLVTSAVGWLLSQL